MLVGCRRVRPQVRGSFACVYVAQPREPRVLQAVMAVQVAALNGPTHHASAVGNDEYMALLHVVVTCEDRGFISR